MIKERFYDFNLNIKEVVALNIKKYRKEKKLTQEQLALYTDLSYDFIRRIESTKGKVGFSVLTLYKIATVLERNIDDFFKEEISDN